MLTANSPGVSLEIVELVSVALDASSSPGSVIAGWTLCSSMLALVEAASTEGSVSCAISMACSTDASPAAETVAGAEIAPALPSVLLAVTFTRRVEPTSPLTTV